MRVIQRASVGRTGGSRGQGGFTFIELLVVIAILAILGGVALFGMSQINHDASIQGCRLESRTLIAAMQAADNAGTPGNYLPYTGGEEPKYFEYSGTGWIERPGVHPGPECPVP